VPRMARRPWLVIAAWVVLLAVSLPFLFQVTTHLSAGGFTAPHSAANYANATTARLVAPPSVPTTLIDGLPPARLASLARANHVPPTWLHTLGPRESVLVPVGSGLAARPLLAAAAHAGAAVTPVTSDTVGNAVSHQAVSAFKASTVVAIPALLILLPLVFGAIFPSLLPLATAGAGSLLSLAVIAVLERYVPLSVYLLEIVTFLALGVGVDYSLFIATRFRARLEAGESIAAALADSMRTSGRSVFFSGVAVALALSALVLGGTTYWRGLALGGSIAVASVLLVTHTLLPALLRLLGPRVRFGRIRFALPEWRLWHVLAGWATGRPIAALVVGVTLLAVPAAFAGGVRAAVPANTASMLPQSAPLAQAVAAEQRALGQGSIAPFVVTLTTAKPLTEPAAWHTVQVAAARLAKLPDVARVASPLAVDVPVPVLARLAGAQGRPLGAFVAGPHAVDLFVTPRSGPDTAATGRLLTAMQARLAHLPGGTAAIGGAVASMHAFDQYLNRRLPWMGLAVALIAFLVLLLATGSVVQAAIGVGLNLLVTLTTAGILVLTVERGSFGLTPQPLNMAVAPLVFVLLFGLSMDYEVILLHRMQERMHAGDSSRHAARHAVGTTGGMITGAGLIMVAVVAALLVSPFEVLQTLGIGLVSAVLLDTLVVRTFVLPAIVTLLGDHAFWPRRHPRAAASRHASA